MSDEHELKEVKSVETRVILREKEVQLTENEAKGVPNSKEYQDSAVQIIYEEGEQVPDPINDIEKSNVPVTLPSETVVSAQMNKPDTNYYNYPNQTGYAQTPYYQQHIRGQPVYVQGVPPADASRMYGPYRMGEGGGGGGGRGGGGGGYGGGYARYSGDSSIFGVSFDNVSVRNRFVQRVYTILTVQLLYTCTFIALCVFVPSIKLFVLQNFILLMVAFATEIMIYFCLVCCISLRRSFPLNFILLGLFTIAFAYIMGVVSSMYSTFIVMTSMGITAAVCLVISLVACQTSVDITTCGVYLCIIGIIVALFGIIAIIVAVVTGSRIMFLVYAGLIAIVFSLYLAYDTQMIMGGRRVELSPEEYIFGALCLYVDIMEIFWAILTLLGMSRS